MHSFSDDIVGRQFQLVFIKTSNVRSEHDSQYYEFYNSIRSIVHVFFNTHNPDIGDYLGDPNYLKALENAIKSFQDLSNKIDIYLYNKKRDMVAPDLNRFGSLKNIALTLADKIRHHLSNLSTSRRPRMLEVRNAIENGKKVIQNKFNDQDIKKLFNSLFIEFGGAGNVDDSQVYRELQYLITNKRDDFLEEVRKILQDVEDHVLFVQEYRSTQKTIDEKFIHDKLSSIKYLFHHMILGDPEISERAQKITNDIKNVKDKYLANLMDTETSIPLVDIKARRPLLNLVRVTHFRKSEADKALAERLRNFDDVLEKSIAPRGPAKLFQDSQESKSQRSGKIKTFNTNRWYESSSTSTWIKTRALIDKDISENMSKEDSFLIRTGGWDPDERRAFNKFLSYYTPSKKKLLGNVAIELIETDFNDVVAFLNAAVKNTDGYVVYNYKILKLHQHLIADQSGVDIADRIINHIKSTYGNRIPSKSEANPIPYHFGSQDASTLIAVVDKQTFAGLASMSFQVSNAGGSMQSTANKAEQKFVRETIAGKFWGWIPVTAQGYDKFQQLLTKSEHQMISNFLLDFNNKINESFKDSLTQHLTSIEAIIYNVQSAIKRVAEEKYISEHRNLDQQRKIIYKNLREFVKDIKDPHGQSVYPMPETQNNIQEENTEAQLIFDHDAFLKCSYFGYLDALKPDISSQLDNEDLLKKWLYNFKFMANLNVFKSIAYQIESKVIDTMRVRQSQLSKTMQLFRNSVNKYDRQSSKYNNLNRALLAIDLQMLVSMWSIRVLAQKLVAAKQTADFPETRIQRFKDKIKKSIIRFFSVIAHDESQTINKQSNVDDNTRYAITLEQCDMGIAGLEAYHKDILKLFITVDKIVSDNDKYLLRLENSSTPRHRVAAQFVRSFLGSKENATMSKQPKSVYDALFTAEQMLANATKQVRQLCYILAKPDPTSEEIEQMAANIVKDPITSKAFEIQDMEEIKVQPADIAVYKERLKTNLEKLRSNFREPKIDQAIKRFLELTKDELSKEKVTEEIEKLHKSTYNYLQELYQKDPSSEMKAKIESLDRYFE